MVEKIRNIQRVPLTENLEKKIAEECLIGKIEELLKRLYEKLEEQIGSKDEVKWVRIQEAPFYYVHAEGTLVGDPDRINLREDKVVEVPGFNTTAIRLETARRLFYEEASQNPLLNQERRIKQKRDYAIWTTQNKCYEWLNDSIPGWGICDGDIIKLPVYHLTKEEYEQILFFLFRKNVDLFESTQQEGKIFSFFTQLIRTEKIKLTQSGSGIQFAEKPDREPIEEIRKFITQNGKNDKLLSIDFSQLLKGKLPKDYKLNTDSQIFREYSKELLACDETRIHMEKYPEYILRDPESGHWGLWQEENGQNTVAIEGTLAARNPVYDALSNRSGVVGIDFGTKSTVVTYRQSTADVMPMRIGSGQLSRAVSAADYENPTVMEIRDIVSFLVKYWEKEGRPDTSWNDLLISHEAFSQLVQEQRSGDTFASFFSELKQWASEKERQVVLKDSKGEKIQLMPYRALKEGDFDPIEIYAYYIGLFINNMVNKIYLRYKMSFPAKVEKEVRDRVLKSFEKGIRKSLPEAVLKDPECMKIFRVEQGASEPAAYAICALQEFGFDPEEDEEIYYGIFDFGGGTTDFDFGIWSSEEEDDNYDYKISRFGEGEDPYLGGENLLGLLAYEVFLDNYDNLLKDNIIFVRPYGTKNVVGKEWLVNQDSQFAHFNLKRLMEKLRGVWEYDPEVRKEVEGGTIQLPLFDKDGSIKNNYNLAVNLEKLDQLIEGRIESGVVQFFSTLKNSFAAETSLDKIHKLEEIHIFLAGNSCKSVFVLRIFERQIRKLYEDMFPNREKPDWIRIYPPLGSLQADKIIRGELKPEIGEILQDAQQPAAETKREADLLEKVQRPNGKTGVAFGLLDNRVRVVQNEAKESGFKYYIGQNRKKKFKCIIDKDKEEYGVWRRFCSASVETFDIWFTRSAEAPSNTLPITDLGIYSEPGFISEPDENASVYIRLVSPTEIEYLVSTLTEEELNKCQEEQMGNRISLQEKR